jgi:hypothetical protein
MRWRRREFGHGNEGIISRWRRLCVPANRYEFWQQLSSGKRDGPLASAEHVRGYKTSSGGPDPSFSFCLANTPPIRQCNFNRKSASWLQLDILSSRDHDGFPFQLLILAIWGYLCGEWQSGVPYKSWPSILRCCLGGVRRTVQFFLGEDRIGPVSWEFRSALWNEVWACW